MYTPYLFKLYNLLIKWYSLGVSQFSVNFNFGLTIPVSFLRTALELYKNHLYMLI